MAFHLAASPWRQAAERRKICSPWREPWDQAKRNDTAPEGRNMIIAVSSVPPLRG